MYHDAAIVSRDLLRNPKKHAHLVTFTPRGFYFTHWTYFSVQGETAQILWVLVGPAGPRPFTLIELEPKPGTNENEKAVDELMTFYRFLVACQEQSSWGNNPNSKHIKKK